MSAFALAPNPKIPGIPGSTLSLVDVQTAIQLGLIATSASQQQRINQLGSAIVDSTVNTANNLANTFDELYQQGANEATLDANAQQWLAETPSEQTLLSEGWQNTSASGSGTIQLSQRSVSEFINQTIEEIKWFQDLAVAQGVIENPNYVAWIFRMISLDYFIENGFAKAYLFFELWAIKEENVSLDRTFNYNNSIAASLAAPFPLTIPETIPQETPVETPQEFPIPVFIPKPADTPEEEPEIEEQPEEKPEEQPEEQPKKNQ